MFGNNPRRKIEIHAADDGKLAVQELFFTVQGEGPFVGQPAPFIRLAGCHLACSFCDTDFESNITNRMAPKEIAAACKEMIRPIMIGSDGVATSYRPLVVLTGGEPMRQEIGPLIEELAVLGFHIQIETAGNFWRESILRWLALRSVTIVISPKTPHVHPELAARCWDWKYIIKAGEVGEDGLPDTGTQGPDSGPPARPRRTASRFPTVWVSPCDEYDPVKNLANHKKVAELAMTFGYRVSLQMHKSLDVK